MAEGRRTLVKSLMVVAVCKLLLVVNADNQYKEKPQEKLVPSNNRNRAFGVNGFRKEMILLHTPTIVSKNPGLIDVWNKLHLFPLKSSRLSVESVDSKEFKCPETYGTFPVLTNCNKYIQCVKGIAHMKTCPSNLHYNIKVKECDFIQVAKCPYKCPNKIGQFPLYGDCSSYIECKAGIPELKICSNGQHWNRQEQRCEDSETAGCPIKCPHPNGTFPTEDDCSSYILCQYGIPRLKTCRPDLFYGPVSHTCEPYKSGMCLFDLQCSEYTNRFPMLGNCHKYIECTRQNNNTANDTLTLRTCPMDMVYNPDTELCDVPDNTICANQCPQPNGIFGITGMCNYYKICNEGTAKLHLCPNGLHFSPTAQQCDDPERAGCVVKCTKLDTTMAIPNKCNAYVECSKGVMQVKHCPPGLHWNPLLNMCDNSGKSICNLECPEKFGLYPIPGRCKDYISCIDGFPLLQRCPEGLHFHPYIHMCALPDEAQCIIKCPKPNGIFPVIGDCSAFITCVQNFMTINSCGKGYHFNVTTKLCDKSENVSCGTKCPSPNGRFLFPGYRQDIFMQCTNGSQIIASCSPGTKFNLTTETCTK